MSLFNINNPNPSQSLIDPFVRITIGNPNSKDADIFTVGDGKLIRASVQLGEGKVQSNCRFTVLDPEQKLADKYFAYIESVSGLDAIVAPQETQQSAEVVSITNSAIDDNSNPGKVLYENTIASTFGYGESTQGGTVGAYGDKLDFNGQYAAMIHPNFVQGAADSEKWRTAYKYAKMRVTNLANNKSTVVTIVTTGPFALGSDGRAARPLRPHPDRKIDLTPGAWKALTSDSTPPGIINVKIEWLESGTTTSSSSSQTPKSKQEAAKTSSNQTRTNVSNYNSYKIADWATPKVGATKNIILIPGHLVDSNGGTGGGVSSVTYNGENRPAEGVATQLAVEVFASELRKSGYSVTTPTTSVRGVQIGNNLSSNAKAFLDQVAILKRNTGAYVLELHFDAPFNSKGEKAGRSGMIPQRLNAESSGSSLNVMDVALGRDKAFGSFSYNHGGVFAAPRRGISILEIDRLSPSLASPLVSGNWQAFKNSMIPYAQKAVAALNTVTSGIAVSTDRAASSINNASSPQVESTPVAKTLAGAQITVELGYGGQIISAHSFIHVGLRYSLFEPHALEFTGQAASWVLTQRIKNTVYTNLTFRKLAQKITSSYGMKLEMPEEGPQYTYFPQRGQTDYEALLIEARRIGYRVYTKGPTLYIQPRKGVDPNQQVFVLQYGDNMGTYFEVNHQASTDSKGGARSSQPGSNNSTGERKFEIDPDSGQMKQKKKENLTGTGANQDASITGSPLPTPAPKTTGDTNTSDSQRKANEDRIKGILANAEFPTTPEALTLDPDTPFKTEGVSTALDRYWVVDSISHEYQMGKFTTKLSCYSPLTNKRASADINTGEVQSISNSVIGSTTENITKAQATGSPYLLVVRTGKKDEVGLELLNVLLIDAQGNAKGSVNASSGNGSNQTFAGPGGTTAGSGDPCEEGLYNLGSEVPGASAGVGAIFIPMNPTFSTTRSAIGLHLDANRSTSPGSAGCIAPHTLAEFSTVRKWIKDNNITTIRCYWGISSTFGNNISKNITNTSTSSTGFIIPSKGNYRSPFGMRNGKPHNGIDIANNLGTPVYASAAGVVNIGASTCKFSTSGNNKIDRDCGGGFGNFITITHVDGYQTIYAHLSEISVTNGSQVSQGQLIGKSGNSGGSNGNHLHWEVIKNGAKINPAKVVRLPSILSSIG